MVIKRGEIIEQVEPIVMNDVTVNPMKTDERYIYLGREKNISYVGPINKDWVTKEYTKELKKSEQANCLDITNISHITHSLFLSWYQRLVFSTGPNKRLNK